jgi:hypothetical protein
MTEQKSPLSPLGVWGSYIDAVSEIGEFVKGSAPTNPVGAAIHGRMRAQCDQFSRGEGRWQFMGPASIYAMQQHCDPYLQDVGSGPPSLEENAPFTGGQCSGDDYNIFFDAYRTDIGPSDTRTFFAGPLVGPIASIDAVQNGTQVVVSAENEAGQTVSNSTGFTSAPLTITNGRVVNIDNPADDCGNLPGEPVVVPNPNPRPDPGLDPGDEPTEDPTGRPVLPMPELPNPWGDPIQIPSIPLPTFGGPQYEPSNDPSPGPGEPGDPVDIPEGGEAEGTADDDEELVGVRLEFTTVPGRPRRPGNVIGSDLYVGAAYVFMGIDGQGLELQSEGTVIESGQFFFAERPADKWRVIAALGYAVKVTPYYREIQL